jgi:catechol 2,3-dioxygenase-like lactoylglutathione lyase family enzyme
MKLELVPVPVSDIDRAKAFYIDRLGFDEGADLRPHRLGESRATDATRLGMFDRAGSRPAQIAMKPGSIKAPPSRARHHRGPRRVARPCG